MMQFHDDEDVGISPAALRVNALLGGAALMLTVVTALAFGGAIMTDSSHLRTMSETENEIAQVVAGARMLVAQNGDEHISSPSLVKHGLVGSEYVSGSFIVSPYGGTPLRLEHYSNVTAPVNMLDISMTLTPEACKSVAEHEADFGALGFSINGHSVASIESLRMSPSSYCTTGMNTLSLTFPIS